MGHRNRFLHVPMDESESVLTATVLASLAVQVIDMLDSHQFLLALTFQGLGTIHTI